MRNCCPALATCGELLDAKLQTDYIYLSEFFLHLVESLIMDYGENMMANILNPIYKLIVIML